MDDEVFTSIIKYLDQGIMSKDKNSKESQVQWLKTVSKYQLDEETLVLKDQKHRWIVPRSQYYLSCIPFIMTQQQGIWNIKRYYRSFQKGIIGLK